MKQKLLSIIIPTYNMEKYLHKCLSSLIVGKIETLEMIEIVVINDGSTDSSSVIAHKFESNYPSIVKVVDKSNGNYGSCINTGLPLCTGKYVKILDADDYFDTVQFEKYLAELKSVDTDLVINSKVTVSINGERIKEWTVSVEPHRVLSFEEASKCFEVVDMHKMAYKRQLLLNMNYHQTEGISYSDCEWSVLPFTVIENAYYIPNCLYYYLVGREGQTVDKSVRSKSLRSIRLLHLSIGDYMHSFNQSSNRSQFLFDTFVFCVLQTYNEFFFEGHFDDKEFREYDSELMTRFSEIKTRIDCHPWVSFIPNLQLAKNWRNRRWIKYTLEITLIKAYLAFSKKRRIARKYI